MGKVTSTLLVAEWVNAFTTAVKNVISPILIVASAAGIVYAIWVGIKFVRAEDKSARDEAKQKLIYVIIGIVVTLALIALFWWLQAYLTRADVKVDNYFGYDQQTTGTAPTTP